MKIAMQKATAKQQPGTKPNLHYNAAFRKAAQTLLTAECINQIEELASHLANPNRGAEA